MSAPVIRMRKSKRRASGTGATDSSWTFDMGNLAGGASIRHACAVGQRSFAGRSERGDEREQLVLLGGGERREAVSRRLSLSVVGEDGVPHGPHPAVVQQARLHRDAPQRL